MTQTAVEWLENQIMTSKYFHKLMEDINSRSTIAQSNIFEQAKEMEKEQMINFAEFVATYPNKNKNSNGNIRLTLYEGGDKDAQPLLTAQKQIRCTTVQIWHTAPLLYSVCYRLINFTDYGR